MSAWAEVVTSRGDDEWLDVCSAALVEVQREALRKAARRILESNPDRSPEFSDGVDWAADQINPDVTP